jgi:hypothetical protein
MKFYGLWISTVVGQTIYVGTSCVRNSQCDSLHREDVALFFEDFPAEYEHLATFIDASFISTAFTVAPRPERKALPPFS